MNKYWNETAGREYLSKSELIDRVVYVDDKNQEDGKWVFSTLQRAVDACADYSTIIIRVVSRIGFHYRIHSFILSQFITSML